MFNNFFQPAGVIGATLGLALTLMSPMVAQAQEPDARPEFLSATQLWLSDAVAAVQTSELGPLRMQVAVGALDSRLKLAPCAKVEPYLPPGTRLWGKTRLGLRCLDGASRWNVFLPVTISAFGPAWVIKGSVASGAVLTESDAMETEVDWAEESSPIMSNPSQWVGQVAARALSTGQALRQSMVRPAQVFQAGTQVRVVAQGAGFQITSDGQAISAGVVGQPARVRMSNGRVMSGVVLDNRTVMLAL
jgi:flagella basal body P-ring formation protein FlgA